MKTKAKPTTTRAKRDGRKDVALKRIQSHFPQVKTVTDAREGVLVTVTEADSKGAVPDDPENCAMAKAAVREKIADGAIIGVGYSWLIEGTKATRFKTSIGVGREITSFDRHHDFAAGVNYRLSPVAPANRLGARPGRKGVHRDDATPMPMQQVHKTARIRALWKK